MSLPSAVHVSPLSSAKLLMTGKHVILLFSRSVPSPSMCIRVYVYYVHWSLLLFVFCFVQKKKEGMETRVVITEGQVGRNQCPIFAFLLSPMRGK